MAEQNARFWSKVDKSGDCWLWIGEKTGGGYGRFQLSGSMGRLVAHRYSYVEANGEIPPGLQLDHLCRNRACVRPDHLEAVSAQTNILRGVGIAAMNAQKATCNKGHPLNADNLIIRRDGARLCRACKKASQAAYQSKPEIQARHAENERNRRKWK